MIVYRELSSLSTDLGFSAKALYSVSNSITKHYHPVKIPKGNGEYRQLTVPDEFLKAIQRRINDKLLCFEPISPYATAYRVGGSTKANACPHVGQKVLLKLDIRHFFDNLIYPVIKEAAFPKERYSEANRILLTILCTYQGYLPQGAPTSPTISNIVMRQFDDTVGTWCEKRGIHYSRYCDDMTFSGDFDPKPVKSMVAGELRKLGLFLNTKKMVVAGKGQKQTVTGIVVNEKASVPTGYKRKLRQELYFCMKYGTDSHMNHNEINMEKGNYILSLLGRVNYACSIETDNEELKSYRDWLLLESQETKR
ncbi:MAG: RNA-directed DNA polymerase [Oscillospiraceae bacterium]|nr:RNA-directed DNA polymerase [Oscillospiraceae bacterium]